MHFREDRYTSELALYMHNRENKVKRATKTFHTCDILPFERGNMTDEVLPFIPRTKYTFKEKYKPAAKVINDRKLTLNKNTDLLSHSTS